MRHKCLDAMEDPEVIRLWFASVPQACDTTECLELLSTDELRTAGRFHFDRDRRVYVLARQVVRTVLGRILQRRPETLVFARDHRGKPRLAGEAADCGLGFNLSHSGSHVACAVGWRREVGVDIEEERQDMDVLALARGFFCPNEVQRLRGAGGAERRHLFLRYWTLKEAYLKAEGSGLGLSPAAVDVSHAPTLSADSPFKPIEDRPRGILVQPLEAPTGCVAAVAASGPAWRLELHAWGAHPNTWGARPT